MSPPPVDTRSISPTWTSRAALAGCPLDTILPSSQAWAASERVLKNLAAHSHSSILTDGLPDAMDLFCYKREGGVLISKTRALTAENAEDSRRSQGKAQSKLGHLSRVKL